MCQILARRTKNNPILLGEPGVGKTAIAEGLAAAIVNRQCPDGAVLPKFLEDKRVMQLDVGLIIAGEWMWASSLRVRVMQLDVGLIIAGAGEGDASMHSYIINKLLTNP